MLALLPKRIAATALALAIGLSAAPSRADEATERWIAALPFGAGQIRRGDVGLGVFFAVGEALLGGTAIAAWAAFGALSTTDPYRPVGQRVPSIPALNAELDTVATVNRVAFAGWAALTAAGVIEAQVSVGRRGSAPRDQPSPRVAMTAAPVPGGASMGLRLAF
jgi:hypothetical protein